MSIRRWEVANKTPKTLPDRAQPAQASSSARAAPASAGDTVAWMTQTAQKAGAKVLLVGMQVPPNYGADYNRQFQAAYAEVAKSSKAALVPFFLKGVADSPRAEELFQADRIHPTQAAHRTLLANVWPTLQKILP